MYLYRSNTLKDMTKVTQTPELTQTYLKEILDYKDGFLYWKKRITKCIHVGEKAGCLSKRISKKSDQSRYVIRIGWRLYLSSRLIFFYHYGRWPNTVDHIDRNPLNDKIENLREATPAQNSRNRTSLKNSSSKYLGVSFCGNNQTNPWRAIINVNGKNIYLGYFPTEELAALSYNMAAVKYWGEFANLNIIEY